MTAGFTRGLGFREVEPVFEELRSSGIIGLVREFLLLSREAVISVVGIVNDRSPTRNMDFRVSDTLSGVP